MVLFFSKLELTRSETEMAKTIIVKTISMFEAEGILLINVFSEAVDIVSFGSEETTSMLEILLIGIYAYLEANNITRFAK